MHRHIVIYHSTHNLKEQPIISYQRLAKSPTYTLVDAVVSAPDFPTCYRPTHTVKTFTREKTEMTVKSGACTLRFFYVKLAVSIENGCRSIEKASHPDNYTGDGISFMVSVICTSTSLQHIFSNFPISTTEGGIQKR